MKKEREIMLSAEQLPLPHDENTENALLATLMAYNDKYEQYSDLLSDDLFYQKKQKAIFRCIEGVITSGEKVDFNSLYNYAQSHDTGMELYHNDFVEIYPLRNIQVMDQDIQRLSDLSKRRRLWMSLQQTSQRVLDMTNNLDDEVNDALTDLNEIQSDIKGNEVADMDAALAMVAERVKANQSGDKEYLTTGFQLFDEYYLLRPETLTVLAAFTGVGKSALALNICMAVARQGIAVAYYSLEMGMQELASRAMSKSAGMPASVIMNKKLSESQMKFFNLAMQRNSHLPVYFDDRSTVDFNKTIRSIRKMVKMKGIKLAIIDYLQIYGQIADDSEESISYMARAAKNIAKETGIAVLLLSQLNRSALHPNIKMLRGSGQIEESADNIVLIDRPEAYPDNKVTKYEGEFRDQSIVKTAKLILAKGRGVGIGSKLVGFEAQHTRFFEMVAQDAQKDFEHDPNLPF